MPTYSYECERCGRRLERFQRVSDEPLKECPDCGGRLRRRITGGAGFVMKGDGGAPGRCGAGGTCCGRSEPCRHPPCEQ